MNRRTQEGFVGQSSIHVRPRYWTHTRSVAPIHTLDPDPRMANCTYTIYTRPILYTDLGSRSGSNLLYVTHSFHTSGSLRNGPYLFFVFFWSHTQIYTSKDLCQRHGLTCTMESTWHPAQCHSRSVHYGFSSSSRFLHFSRVRRRTTTGTATGEWDRCHA